jgi:hypothetical protein
MLTLYLKKKLITRCGTPVIPALWRLKQEDLEFKVILGYLERLSQKDPQK